MLHIFKLACASLASAALACALAPNAQANGPHDRLFIGDGTDNNVEVFDAVSGLYQRTLPTAAAPVVGPRGILAVANTLLLVNQNVDQPFNGEVLRFTPGTGAGLPPVVAGSRADAPFAPRGMVRWHDRLFVANVCNPCNPPKESGGGAVFEYTATGRLVATLTPPASRPAEFHPFGLVIGPDGRLYVSSRQNLFTTDPGGELGGEVLRFDPDTGAFRGAFVSSSGGDDRLNGPEGLVFGPDGRLYVTSFQGSDADTDKILVFDGPYGAQPGRRVGRIVLDQAGAGAPRSTAQTLLFGPGGDLFVPISNVQIGNGIDQGAIRRYRIRCTPSAARSCVTDFVSPGGPLGQGWYLTFGRTRPGTLAYGG